MFFYKDCSLGSVKPQELALAELYFLNNRKGREGTLREGRQGTLREGRQGTLREGRQRTLREGRQGTLREGRQGTLREGRHGMLREGRQATLREGRQGTLREGRHGTLREGRQGTLREGRADQHILTETFVWSYVCLVNMCAPAEQGLIHKTKWQAHEEWLGGGRGGGGEGVFFLVTEFPLRSP